MRAVPARGKRDAWGALAVLDAGSVFAGSVFGVEGTDSELDAKVVDSEFSSGRRATSSMRRGLHMVPRAYATPQAIVSPYQPLTSFSSQHPLSDRLFLAIVLDSLDLLDRFSRGKFSEREAVNDVLCSKYLPHFMKMKHGVPYLTNVSEFAVHAAGYPDLGKSHEARRLPSFRPGAQPFFRLRLQPSFGRKKSSAMKETGKTFVRIAVESELITCTKLVTGRFRARCRKPACRQEHRLVKALTGNFRNFRRWRKAVAKHYKNTIGEEPAPRARSYIHSGY